MLEMYSCSMVLEGYLGTYSQVLVEVGKLWRRIESMRGNFCVPVVAFIKLSIYKTNKKQMSGGGGGWRVTESTQGVLMKFVLWSAL